MTTYRIIRTSLSSLALALGALASACGAPVTAEEIGSLELPLTAQGTQGTVFGLGGTFLLNGVEGLIATSSPTDGAASLSLNPRVGSYSLSLCDGTQAQCAGAERWVLYELQCSDPNLSPAACTAGGAQSLNATPRTDAVLTSTNPLSVNIAANQTTTAAFQFLVPGEGPIVFARGNLSVNVSVSEGLAAGAVCTAATQCRSHVCSAAGGGGGGPGGTLTCQAPTCVDGVQNGAEIGPDCGGNCAALCPTMSGPTCSANLQCGAGQTCTNGTCVPTPTPTSCTRPADCGAGQTCQLGANGMAGTCVTATGGQCNCPLGQPCNANGTCG
jgi:hypothetical protein